jgi:hypothetical protein
VAEKGNSTLCVPIPLLLSVHEASYLQISYTDISCAGQVSGLLRTLLRSSPACEAFLNALLAIIDQQNATHSWTGWGCDLGEGTRSTEPGASLPVAIWALLTNGGAAWLSVIECVLFPLVSLDRVLRFSLSSNVSTASL